MSRLSKAELLLAEAADALLALKEIRRERMAARRAVDPVAEERRNLQRWLTEGDRHLERLVRIRGELESQRGHTADQISELDELIEKAGALATFYPPKVSFYQEISDTKRLRGAILHEGDESLSEFINRVLMAEVKRLEQLHNKGKPFPPGAMPRGAAAHRRN